MIKFLLAAVVAVSRIGASQSNDSLWAVSTGGTLSVCENPSSPTSLDTCFSGTPKTNARSLITSQMTSNGKNVYYYDLGDGSRGSGSIVSCPISSLSDGCKSLVGLTGLPEPYPFSMAASIAYLYLGYSNGDMYRCPLASSGVSCVKFNNAGGRIINSLVLANGRLYAGLGEGEANNGLIWNCDPITEDSCDDFNNPGKNNVNELAVGAGYLWAVLSNSIIWRCRLDVANSCVDWYKTEVEVQSISFDAGDGSTFYAGTNNNGGGLFTKGKGRIYKCSAYIQGGCTLSPSTNKQVRSVAGGMGSVFWSIVEKSAGPPFIYARFFPSTTYAASTSSNWAGTQLLYIPGPTLTTASVVGTSSTGGGRKLMKQDDGNCQELAEKVYDALKDIIQKYSKFINFIDDEDISCAISKGSLVRGVVKSANECSITIDVVAKVRGLGSPLKKYIADRLPKIIDKFDVERVEVEPTCKANGGANNGKYDEGNAKGAQNGHGYGVNKDPNACSFKKKKKQCKKDGLCDWDGTACSDMSSSLMEEQVGNTVNVQPKSAAHQDATKISAIATGLILIWLGGM